MSEEHNVVKCQCGSIYVVKAGTIQLNNRRKFQRYKCKECGRLITGEQLKTDTTVI
jgi:transposase-like protein